MNENKTLENIEIEYLYLKQLWEEYKNIFSSRENIEAINTYCGGCFHLIQVVLNNEIIITLNRIMDPVGNGTNKNLVLETLSETIKNNRDSFQKKIDDIREILRNCNLKKVRNKRLAHSDKKEKERDGNYFLIADYDCLEDIVLKIEDSLKYYREQNSLEYMAYEHSISPPGCECLITAIKSLNAGQKEIIELSNETNLISPDNLSFIELIDLLWKKIKFWRN